MRKGDLINKFEKKSKLLFNNGKVLDIIAYMSYLQHSYFDIVNRSKHFLRNRVAYCAVILYHCVSKWHYKFEKLSFLYIPFLELEMNVCSTIDIEHDMYGCQNI